MYGNAEIYDFILDNIQKVMIPEEINAIGLTISRLELFTLLMVARAENMTMSSLAQAMAVPMSTATGIADRLVKKNLLGRGGLPEDRRVVTVFLTDSGQVFVKNLQKTFHTFVDRIRKVLSDDEFQQVIVLAEKVITGLKAQEGQPEQRESKRKKITVE